MLPNLLLIGAQKSGTTSLHHYLSEHPEVFMSNVKEPKFFALDGKLPRFVGPYVKRTPATTSLDDYCKLFDGAESHLIRGESSTWYLCTPESPGRIQKLLPDVKMVAVLRHPIDRAWSNFRNNRWLEIEPLDDFQAALDAEPQRQRDNWGHPWYYVGKGLYHEQLCRFWRCFDRSQIQIHLYDDLVNEPSVVLRQTFEFLGVDPSFKFTEFVQHNVTPRSQDSKSWFGRTSQRIRKPWFRKQESGHRPSPQIADDLFNDLLPSFRDDIFRLQDALQRDLSFWLLPFSQRRPKHENVSLTSPLRR